MLTVTTSFLQFVICFFNMYSKATSGPNFSGKDISPYLLRTLFHMICILLISHYGSKTNKEVFQSMRISSNNI